MLTLKPGRRGLHLVQYTLRTAGSLSGNGDCGGHLGAGPLLALTKGRHFVFFRLSPYAPLPAALLQSPGAVFVLFLCLHLDLFFSISFSIGGRGDGFFFSRYHICASPPPCYSQWVPFSCFTSAVLQRTCILEGSFDKHLGP